MLRKFKFHLLASAALIGLAALIACSPTTTPPATATTAPATATPLPATATAAPAELDIDALRNASYDMPDLGAIQLVDGAYEDKYGDGATQVNQVGFLSAALGDLNTDAADDAAVALWMNTGGSGTFIYLAAMVDVGGIPVQSDIGMLGDRAQVEQMAIDSGVITVDILTHGPDDPMCCPSQRVTQTYQLQDGKLLQLSVEIHPTPTSDAPAALTLDIIENAAYRSEWPEEGAAKLVDGIYREKYTEDSASELVVALYSDAYAFGDLNGDGAGDAAVVLATSGGGSGTFMTLEVLRNDAGAPHHVATAQLGDRAQIESITVDAGIITVRMLTHGPDDPMCCPSQNVTQTYQLQGEELIQLSSEVEADEPPAYVELADGTRCAFAGSGATLAFDGKRLNYTCETAGDDEVGLIGDLVQQGDDWVAEKAIIGHDDTGFFLKESEMVTVLIVEE